MVATVPSEGDSWIGITSETENGYLVCKYADSEDAEGTIVGNGDLSLDEVLDAVRGN